MNDVSDPKSHLKAIQLCLQSDKRPVGFFLGAGCPLAIRVPDGDSTKALIPDIRGLTRAVVAEIEKTKPKPDADVPHRAVVKALTEACAEDGNDDATVEDFLNRLRAIHAVGGTRSVRGIIPAEAKAADRRICDLVHQHVQARLPSQTTPYHSLARWIRDAVRTDPVEIFTPNYDLLFEQAFEECGTPYFDGFVGSRRAFIDAESMEGKGLPTRWSRLWKLHGSINWHRDASGEVWRGSDHGSGEMLIYPSHHKITQSRKLPFFAMLDRLKAFLSKPGAVLITCGYSFADEHFNILIRERLRSNPQLVVFALIHGQLGVEHPALNDGLTDEPNFLLLGHSEGVIGGRRTSWSDGAFELGDFAELGKLLTSVSGSQSLIPNADAQ